MHTVFVPFMIMHWVANNNTCVLTTTEKYLRGGINTTKDEDCYTCQLINPIFDVTKNYNQFSNWIYIITIGLWLFSSYKLYNKFKTGQIKNIRDLYQI